MYFILSSSLFEYVRTVRESIRTLVDTCEYALYCACIRVYNYDNRVSLIISRNILNNAYNAICIKALCDKRKHFHDPLHI